MKVVLSTCFSDVFDHEGGPVLDSNVFLKSVNYRPTLRKFRGGGRGGQLKKHPVNVGISMFEDFETNLQRLDIYRHF